MRVVAIIQARIGSTRLPGKILKPLAGKPVLQRVIERVRASRAFDEVVVATTVRDIDDPAAEAAADFGATVVRGDENDVLSRYGLAAEASAADAIMRITADCPLIDPDVLGAMTDRFRGGDADLVSNCLRRTFPRGLDAELFSRSALDIMLTEAATPAEREHVTPFLYTNPDRFRIVSHEGPEDFSDYRLTLDTPEDFELLDRIFAAASDPDTLALADVIALFETHLDWRSINAHVEQQKI
ncbi:MAG: glycosyltransferase family protein [Alphaproteobacteria bacterium]|nr:glycosyltransferase family protein [Alphaproteobacteria bacterium]MBU0864433.1 glycosyltransferase family protein [Alphaproteobacteria bacterium]MBU1823970.1 glycosyltransferase family protein [Alphaproteobacteria bacterium]